MLNRLNYHSCATQRTESEKRNRTPVKNYKQGKGKQDA